MILFNILTDFVFGLYHSLRIDSFLFLLFTNKNIRKHTFKIFKYHCLLLIFIQIIIDLYISQYVCYWILHLVKIINLIFYFLNCTEFQLCIINDMKLSENSHKSKSILELSSMIITMVIYQLSILITNIIINYLFFESMYLVYFISNYLALTIYHSFYCHNNVWQKNNVDLSKRINMFEIKWPYYFGFGTISAILYTYSNTNMYILGIYNMYMLLIICIPFLGFSMNYVNNLQTTYPKIDLSIFAYISEWIIRLFHLLKINPQNNISTDISKN
jgi:hypothetical protein